MVHTGTVFPVLKTYDKGSIAAGRTTRHHAITINDGITLQFRNLLDFLLHFAHYLLRLMKCTTFRAPYFCEEYALVLLWHETRRQASHREDEQHGCYCEQCPS